MKNLLFKLVIWIIARKLTVKQLTYVRDIVGSRLAKIKKKEGIHKDKDLSGNKGIFKKGYYKKNEKM